MAWGTFKPHPLNMDRNRRRPRIGDRVRISGFLGQFEIVQIRQEGLMTDLKHLGFSGPDYIEREILSRELIYEDQQEASQPSR
ncbi:MAG: hypothetical protein ABSF28_12270 [Terracidiphilus sp.]|jgi:hypothetical protein